MPDESESRVMEMRPRCLVIVPGLSFEEFQEQVWEPIRARRNAWPQLKWVAEAIPPARRRDDCNWTAAHLSDGG